MRDDSHGDPPSFGCIHHVPLAMRRGFDGDVRHFYGSALGMAGIERLPALAKGSGAWFRVAGVEIHLAVERDVRPADKAHPAIRVDDVDAIAGRLASFGIGVEWDEAIPDVRLFHVRDPAGNRLEFIQLPRSAGDYSRGTRPHRAGQPIGSVRSRDRVRRRPLSQGPGTTPRLRVRELLQTHRGHHTMAAWNSFSGIFASPSGFSAGAAPSA